REEKQILAEGMVAEGGLPRYFFLSLQQKEGALLLRCLPSTDPEKTPGVKRLILRLGLTISELLSAGVEPCNLEGEWEAFRTS
ncbi:MAG: hypothetical protein QF492_06040, partial [Candidatus Krumholzibacteria bacterium]|nr:hypothetical protein [Candidatus Krumholzibacteria bacterium]